MTQPEIKVGSIWADDDPRQAGRRLKVIAVDGDQVVCVVTAVARNVSETRIGTSTRIRRNRFRPGSSGYRLVEQAPR